MDWFFFQLIPIISFISGKWKWLIKQNLLKWPWLCIGKLPIYFLQNHLLRRTMLIMENSPTESISMLWWLNYLSQMDTVISTIMGVTCITFRPSGLTPGFELKPSWGQQSLTVWYNAFPDIRIMSLESSLISLDTIGCLHAYGAKLHTCAVRIIHSWPWSTFCQLKPEVTPSQHEWSPDLWLSQLMILEHTLNLTFKS